MIPTGMEPATFRLVAQCSKPVTVLNGNLPATEKGRLRFHYQLVSFIRNVFAVLLRQLLLLGYETLV
jgi:hypothetical protein